MNIRTVSDLTEIQHPLADEDLVEVSHSNGENRYSSHKYKIGNLRNDIVDRSVDESCRTFSIGRGTDLSAPLAYVLSLSACVDEEDGTVTFDKQPRVENPDPGNHDPNFLQTREQVCQIAEDKSCFIGPASYTECEPLNDAGSTQDYDYYWKIEGGQYDSSLALDEDGFQMDGVRMERTGWLVVYGWLASDADVLPQNAWVALYGLFDDEDNWKVMQVQPWIVGKHSQQMQYVSFGVPVRAGAKLKIMTGFPVNGTVSGFQTYSHTLLLQPQRGNIINSFVGYVISNR